MPKFIRVLSGILGAAIFLGLLRVLFIFFPVEDIAPAWRLYAYIGAGIIGFLIFFLLTEHGVRLFRRLVEALSEKVEKIPFSDVLVGVLGLIIGLVIAGLITHPILGWSFSVLGNSIGVLISVIIYLVLGLLGIRIAVKNKSDIARWIHQWRPSSEDKKEIAAEGKREKKKSHSAKMGKNARSIRPKVLDTSSIIDARIFEVIELGFLEGPFIISELVLQELQHIADSPDSLRRERGRRGLDQLADFQEHNKDVLIDESDFGQDMEVDLQLVKLAADRGGILITNDFNLNKVARVQNIQVLNVNELANALRPNFIPGDTLSIEIRKAGKEYGQGIGYLDDGTMVVVENGYEYLGQKKDMVVTSVLQSPAGKMVFTRVEE